MSQIRISTTGAYLSGSPVPISDLGAVEFEYPLTNFVIFDTAFESSEFSFEEIIASKDLQNAINEGYVIIDTDLGVNLSDISDIRRILYPLPIFSGATTEGFVPNPVIEENKFLRDDGTWAIPILSGLTTGVTITVNTITDDVNNYEPANWNEASIVRINIDGNHDITGFKALNHGDEKTLMNLSHSKKIKIFHNSASSISVNRIYTSKNKNYTLQKNASVKIVYDGISQRWRIVDGAT